MTIAVLADEKLMAEFRAHTFPPGTSVIEADSLRSLQVIEADVYFDLLFEPGAERMHHLARLLPRPVVVNSVINTCQEMGHNFIRLNAWPTMLKRPVAEIATLPGSEDDARDVFQSLSWEPMLVPDVTGMITPRIVATIINEACFTLAEGISTRDEIDLAMRLGTNYPYGPFEWRDLVGAERIEELLRELNRNSSRYTIAPNPGKSFTI